ncbi:UDP-3-O-[3-hydroxymyristoyl] glucosamine N-acyltransferase [Loktanella sp. DSM 29012]|uniref:UDP-3-O-(3-hydroxymyristoyl)glucosamine N-acyltransferase n=1 Tax=Loktanella sp. DSM 29012 TaxID=1881056 RepID=UPI0008C7CB90|nr:UDP-3-O-(3-hydroxymyristoyl)glucosamine N-acyltransferase [Loktanella sp. DSM 29012]SEQ14460.1 UDP-3-O-[3-hydroxymyristoyl] glucosamine N-acyltransferase [Loktanella sp. DSM 29012]
MPLTIAEIAQALGTTAHGNTALVVQRPAEPGSAGPDDLALAMSKAYADALRASQARAAIVWDGADLDDLGLAAAITVPRARLAMAQLTQAFDPRPTGTGIHPTAVIDPAAQIGADVHIGPFVVIGSGVALGDGCRIDSHVSIGDRATLGAGCWLGAGTRIGRDCHLGARVITQPNAVIGSDGFSYVTTDLANEERAIKTMGRTPLTPPQDGTRHRIHSLGGVVLGDDVEVGSNSTIDAGTIRPTRIGRGTKIDNQVHIGHNCVVGEDCIVCGHVGLAGSGTFGDRCVFAGKVGTKDHVTLGNDVVMGGGANVYSDFPDGAFVMGSPALDMPDHRAQQKALRGLPQLQKIVADLRARLTNPGEAG